MPNIKRGMMGAAGSGAAGDNLYVWGDGSGGRLGLGAAGGAASKSSPVQLGDSEWASVGAGGRQGLGIRGNGSMYNWGINSSGEVGDGTVISRSSPVQIGALSWAWVSGGNAHSTAVTPDGKLYTWGAGAFGRLGVGTVVSASAPVQVGSLTTWLRARGGGDITVALKTDGTIWAWGNGYYGALGQGGTGPGGEGGVDLNYSSPVQIGSDSDWADVQAGANYTAALKDNGTLWTVGLGTNGRSGHGNVTQLSSLTQVGSLTTWAKIGVCANHMIATTTAGTMFGWGQNADGAVGDGTAISRSSPVQIGALTTWSIPLVGPSGGIGVAIKTDGTLWNWGSGSEGKLGHGDTITRSSPVQVGSETDWTSGMIGSDHFYGIREA